jgi:hypothetical protein
MARLRDLAKMIRSKNAGPFVLTVDIIFADEPTYRRVKDSNVLNVRSMAEMFDVAEADVQFFHYDPAYAIKVSVPRFAFSGDPDDSDIFGGQQHGPLVDIEIPD